MRPPSRADFVGGKSLRVGTAVTVAGRFGAHRNESVTPTRRRRWTVSGGRRRMVGKSGAEVL